MDAHDTVVEVSHICPYCEENLSIVKGGSSVNGLHAACARAVSEEMDRAYGDSLVQITS